MNLLITILMFMSNLSFAQNGVKETRLNIAIGIDEIVKFDYKYINSKTTWDVEKHGPLINNYLI